MVAFTVWRAKIPLSRIPDGRNAVSAVIRGNAWDRLLQQAGEHGQAVDIS